MVADQPLRFKDELAGGDVASSLERLAGELAPGCDPGVVVAVWEQASAGYRHARGPGGLRASTLTPAGVPFEASVTGGSGTVVPALRYVAEAGSNLPFFTARLAAQRTALEALVGWLPDGAAAVGASLGQFLDAVFPDPAAVPARNRFATYFGIVHQSAWPAGISGLKLYGHLCGDWAGLDRLASLWSAFGDLRARLDGLDALLPAFAGLEVDGAGRVGHKMYVRPRHGDVVDTLARRYGTSLAPLTVELERFGAGVQRWSKVLVGTVSDGSTPPTLTVYLPAKALGLDRAGMQALARQLAARHHGSTEAAATLARCCGPTWPTTIVALGLAPTGPIDKFTIYTAPTAEI